MRILLRYVIVIFCLLAAGSPAFAQAEGQVEVPRGLWATAPDNRGVILHVRTRRCGRALCGRVERAKNRRGYDTPSDAVGAKVLWEMRPQPDGGFFGEYRGPDATRYLKSRVEVRGRELILRACDDSICRKTTWKRLR